MYKKRRRSSWPSQLLATGLLLGGSCWITTPAFADDCGDPGSPITVTVSPNFSKSCAIETGSDEDWFTFTAQAAGYSYTIKADQVGADIDVAVELRSPNNTTVQSSQNRGFEGESETLNYTATATADSVWIRVFHTGFFGSKTAYQLSITEMAPQAKEIKVISGDKQAIKAGQTPTAITFQLLDTNDNGMTGQTVQFTLSSDSPQVTIPASDQTGENGNVVLSLPVLTTTGTYTIKATAESGKEATATVTVTPGDLASLTLTPNTDCQSPHSADNPCTLKVEGKDGGGNTVSVASIELQLTLSGVSPETRTITVTNEGNTGDLKLKVGSYTIKATSPVQSVKDVTVEVVAGAPTTLEKVSSTCQDSQAANQPCDLVFKLVDQNQNVVGGKTVNFALTPNNDGTTLTNSVESDSTAEKLGEVKVTLTPATTLTAPVQYTVSAISENATLTINPAVTVTVVAENEPPPPVPQPTYFLTVASGGNQSVTVEDQPSQPVLFQLTMTTDDQGEPVTVTTPMEVTLTLTNPLDSDDKVSLSSYDENGTKVAGNGEVTGKTDGNGQVKLEVSFSKKEIRTGVTTYLLSAKLKENPNVADYTNVFLLEKPLDKLLETWPTLKELDDHGLEKTGGNTKDGKGVAFGADGTEDINVHSLFHGGLSLNQENKFLQTPQKPEDKVKLSKDKDGNPHKDDSDHVIVQGVIQVDRAHIGQTAEIVVFGENDSPTALDAADGCYMLGSSAMIDLQTLGGREVCQRFRDKKMTGDDMAKLIPFKRGVTLTDKVVVEMYTGTFYYGADSLRIYFGYRLADGTLVYNGSNPIYITIEETSPATPATKEVPEAGGQSGGETTEKPSATP